MISLTEKQPKRALGRGLSALIPQASVHPIAGEPVEKAVVRLAIESVSRDPNQPRKTFDEQQLQALAESIRSQGLIQPILVRREGTGYRLIAGERRWRAAQLAGLHEIPAVVRNASDGEALELALVENLQRADLNPLEEAEGYRRLLEEFALTQEQVSQRVGKDRSTVANALRLLALPAPVKEMVRAGTLSMGHARALLGLSDPEQLVSLANKVVAQKLSVRETEKWVGRMKATPAESAGSREQKQNPHVRQVLEQLQRILGTKVRLIEKGGRGRLELDFFSQEDLNRLLMLLRK